MHPSGSNTTPTRYSAAGLAQPAQIANQPEATTPPSPSQYYSSPAVYISGPPDSSESQSDSSSSRPQARTLTAQHYAYLADRMYLEISKHWVPHIMPPDVALQHLLATRRCIERIRVLEAEQAARRPAVDPRIEQALFVRRIDYRTRFPRIFRINDLPTEILTNIMRFVCWSAHDPRSSTRTRLHLTWVCRQWRAVMFDDHTLWNAIWFSDFPNYERSFAWLDR